jgi:hypothetical protein
LSCHPKPFADISVLDVNLQLWMLLVINAVPRRQT